MEGVKVGQKFVWAPQGDELREGEVIGFYSIDTDPERMADHRMVVVKFTDGKYEDFSLEAFLNEAVMS